MSDDLRLFVDGRFRLSTPNTPEGRTRINKAALRYSEGSEDVTVRGESGSSGMGVATLNGLVTDEPTGPGKDRFVSGDPAKRALSPIPCCEPKTFPGPSGIRKRHSFLCKVAPGRPFSRVSVHDISDLRLSRRHAIETRRTGLDDSIRSHPVSYLSPQAHDRWHPGQGEDCLECAERGHPG